MLNATVALTKDSDKKEKSSKKKGSAVTQQQPLLTYKDYDEDIDQDNEEMKGESDEEESDEEVITSGQVKRVKRMDSADEEDE